MSKGLWDIVNFLIIVEGWRRASPVPDKCTESLTFTVRARWVVDFRCTSRKLLPYEVLHAPPSCPHCPDENITVKHKILACPYLYDLHSSSSIPHSATSALSKTQTKILTFTKNLCSKTTLWELLNVPFCTYSLYPFWEATGSTVFPWGKESYEGNLWGAHIAFPQSSNCTLQLRECAIAASYLYSW